MRIIHTSDWHLGQHFYGKSRANEHQQFLNWLVAESVSKDIDAIIVAGDIFDTGTPPSYAREMYFDFIAKLHQTKCQLVVLAGNHDSVAMLSESQKLLKQLSTQVISAVSDNIDEQVFVLSSLKTSAQAVMCAIPFIRARDIVKSFSGQSAEDKQRSLQQAISQHYQTLYEHAKNIANKNSETLPIVATGHLTTIGASVSDSVRDIYIGTLEAFPASEFPPADYIALGHIHRPQRVTKEQHIRYSGSPIALSFDEATTQKSIVIAEFEQGKLTQVNPIDIPCFQPLAMVKTNLENLHQDIVNTIKNHGLEESSNNSEAEPLWLDIEIDSAEYLQDLTARIEKIITELPVEILLVRRSKKSRQQMPSSEKKVTLNELSVQDVFEARIALEEWQSEEQIARKKRLNDLYLDIAQQTQLDAKPESSNETLKYNISAEQK